MDWIRGWPEQMTVLRAKWVTATKNSWLQDTALWYQYGLLLVDREMEVSEMAKQRISVTNIFAVSSSRISVFCSDCSSMIATGLYILTLTLLKNPGNFLHT